MNYDEFVESLNHLRKLVGVRASTSRGMLSTLCEDDPLQVQIILFDIECKLDRSNAPEYKLIKLFHFALCMAEIKSFLLQTTEQSLKKFFLTNCIKFLCHQIGQAEGDFLTVLTDYLLYFCREFATAEAAIFSENLTFIICGLLQKFVQLDSDVEQERIFKILKLFLVDLNETFSGSIKFLPEMPPHPKLNDLNLSKVCAMESDSVVLTQEIDQFNEMHFVSSESLMSLAAYLGTCKDQLVEVYAEASEVGDSESCINSRLHRMVNKLLSIIQSSESDANKSRLAAKCLGELGASNLYTTSLLSQKQLDLYEPLSNLKKCFSAYYTIILKALNDLIVDESIEVKLAASRVANQIAQSEIGKWLFSF